MGFFSRSKTSGARRPQAAQRPSTAHQSVLSRQRVRRGGAGRNVRIERGPQAEVQDRPASKKGMAGAFLDRYFAGYDWARFRITLVFCFFGLCRSIWIPQRLRTVSARKRTWTA